MFENTTFDNIMHSHDVKFVDELIEDGQLDGWEAAMLRGYEQAYDV